MTDPRPDLQAHYGRQGLLEEIEPLLAACAASGDGAATAAAALARADEFHPGGRAATDALVAMAGPLDGARILDIGCGIGGPARHLRRLAGPRGAVVGVDAVAEYCRTARALNAREVATADIVIDLADATELGLPGPRFDLVWSQQAQMNVADKAGWLASVARHLAPGGRYAYFEAFSGKAGPPAFPVPWATQADESHLVAPEAWLGGLEAAGLAPTAWCDHSAATVAWLDDAVAAQRALAAAGDPAAALSVRLLLGPEAAAMSRNLRTALAEGRLRVCMGTCVKVG